MHLTLGPGQQLSCLLYVSHSRSATQYWREKGEMWAWQTIWLQYCFLFQRQLLTT